MVPVYRDLGQNWPNRTSSCLGAAREGLGCWQRFYEVEGAVDEGLVAQAVLHDQLAGVDERGQLLCRDKARFPLRYSNVSFMLPVR